LQTLDGSANRGIEPRAAAIKMRENRCTHARVPEFADMLRGAGHRSVWTLAGKELADLVCHIDEFVHWLGVCALRQRKLPSRF